VKIRIFTKNNSALSGVIEALLLVALVAVILSTIQLIYIPEIMKQKESDHLDEVENQFSKLKSTIETQSMMGVIQSSETIAYSPMSSIISLGTKRLPYFVTSDTYGKIQINDINVCLASNTIIDLEDLPNEYLNGIPLTSIRYDFFTMYTSYDPLYILEGGGIIYNQTGKQNETGEVMRVIPAITIENNTNTTKIYFFIPVFDCIPGKDNIQGLDEAYIRTNYSSHITYSDTDVSYIRFYSNYLDAWNNCFIKDGEGILWEYYNHNPKYINVDKYSNYIEISPGSKKIDIEFTIVKLGIQTGYGMVI